MQGQYSQHFRVYRDLQDASPVDVFFSDSTFKLGIPYMFTLTDYESIKYYVR